MFIIQAGNPISKAITIKYKKTGLPYDLTDKIILYALKQISDKAKNDDNALLKGSITSHTNAAQGQTRLEISETETNIAVGTYKFDIRLYRDNPRIKINTRQIPVIVEQVVTESIV
jgi:hypothetical protein